MNTEIFELSQEEIALIAGGRQIDPPQASGDIDPPQAMSSSEIDPPAIA